LVEIHVDLKLVQTVAYKGTYTCLCTYAIRRKPCPIQINVYYKSDTCEVVMNNRYMYVLMNNSNLIAEPLCVHVSRISYRSLGADKLRVSDKDLINQVKI